jgi:flagellar biosynthesis protein FlhG
MAILLPFASGKGGVGKTVLAANLAYALARKGKKVVLVDLDWGGSNAHTVLGVLNSHAGLGDYILDPNKRLAELVLPLDVPGLSLVPGDGLVAGAANLPFVRKRKLLRELPGLDADYVLLDLGAGSHSQTIDFFLASALGFVVTVAEPTAILNAFSFLKTALYRLMYQSAPARSPARGAVTEFFTAHQSSRIDLEESLEWIRQEEPKVAEKLTLARSRLKPLVILNMGREAADLSQGAHLRRLCEKQLGLGIEYVALTPWDPDVHASVVGRRLLARDWPKSPLSRAVEVLARRIVERGFPGQAPIGSFDDLEGLAEDFPLP